MDLRNRIEKLLEEKFKEKDFDDCFLVDLKLFANKRMEVYFDSDSGVTISKCQKISRYLEANIEEEQLMVDNYTLEVSSAGIDAPLKLKRQYHTNKGRTLEITLTDGTKKEGILKEMKNDIITLELKEGKGKKLKTTLVEIPYDSIEKSYVKATF